MIAYLCRIKGLGSKEALESLRKTKELGDVKLERVWLAKIDHFWRLGGEEWDGDGEQVQEEKKQARGFRARFKAGLERAKGLSIRRKREGGG